MQPNFQTVTWNFSKTGHGKSPADGVGGTVKSMTDCLVNYGTEIPNSEAFFTFFQETELKVKSFKVTTNNIKEIDAIIRKRNSTAIFNTIHCIKSHGI